MHFNLIIYSLTSGGSDGAGLVVDKISKDRMLLTERDVIQNEQTKWLHNYADWAMIVMSVG